MKPFRAETFWFLWIYQMFGQLELIFCNSVSTSYGFKYVPYTQQSNFRSKEWPSFVISWVVIPTEIFPNYMIANHKPLNKKYLGDLLSDSYDKANIP